VLNCKGSEAITHRLNVICDVWAKIHNIWVDCGVLIGVQGCTYNARSYGLELVCIVWKYECDYVRIDVIALINGLAYEYVINSNEILEVEKVRKVVV